MVSLLGGSFDPKGPADEEFATLQAMSARIIEVLRSHGIQPSAQRVAIAGYLLETDEHPSADQVHERVRGLVPMISRATVYNTLNLFVRAGLLRQLTLREGSVVYDPHLAPHHHFVDEQTGRIHDIPWDALRVEGVEALDGFRVAEHQVVLRGTRTAPE